MERSRLSGAFTDDNHSFQKKILERSGLGKKTYFPESVLSVPPYLSMDGKAQTVMLGVIDELMAKTGVKAKDIGILVVNCSLFSPTPSLSAMIVNHYKLRGNILSYNLGGMGCRAGLISIDDLATQLLQANPNSYALVASMESGTQNWYLANNRSLMPTIASFEWAGRRSSYPPAGRTDIGPNTSSFTRCTLTRVLMTNALRAFKGLDDRAGQNLKNKHHDPQPAGPSPCRNKLFFAALLARKVLKMKIKTYIPDFKLAFDHFCIHAAGRAVLDE